MMVYLLFVELKPAWHTARRTERTLIGDVWKERYIENASTSCLPITSGTSSTGLFKMIIENIIFWFYSGVKTTVGGMWSTFFGLQAIPHFRKIICWSYSWRAHMWKLTNYISPSRIANLSGVAKQSPLINLQTPGSTTQIYNLKYMCKRKPIS